MIVDSMVSVLYRPEKPISLLHAREIIVESAKGLGITLEPVVTAVKTIQAHFRGYQKRRSIVVKEKAIFATNSIGTEHQFRTCSTRVFRSTAMC